MIKGAEKTPYEDGLFFFDFQLSADYPKAPPVCFYHRWVVYFCANLNMYLESAIHKPRSHICPLLSIAIF